MNTPTLTRTTIQEFMRQTGVRNHDIARKYFILNNLAVFAARRNFNQDSSQQNGQIGNQAEAGNQDQPTAPANDPLGHWHHSALAEMGPDCEDLPHTGRAALGTQAVAGNQAAAATQNAGGTRERNVLDVPYDGYGEGSIDKEWIG